MMSDNAKFSEHVLHVSAKVRQKCGWIMRTFKCRKTYFLKFMWKSLVQGHIDYCSQLYFPSQSKDLEVIEDLQRNFTKKIPEVRCMDYWGRLKHLKGGQNGTESCTHGRFWKSMCLTVELTTTYT